MSELATLARPYASGVFKLAKQSKTTGKWSESLAFLSALLNNKDISTIVDNPKLSKQTAADMLLEVCQEHLDVEGVNFLKLIVENNRLPLVPSIAEQFEALKADDEGYVDVEVYSAFEFSKEDKKSLSSTLEKKLSKKIHMNVTVDKTLIGGILVRAGDRVMDGSIRGQLQHMQKTLQ